MTEEHATCIADYRKLLSEAQKERDEWRKSFEHTNDAYNALYKKYEAVNAIVEALHKLTSV
jgi:hypothetical protein